MRFVRFLGQAPTPRGQIYIDYQGFGTMIRPDAINLFFDFQGFAESNNQGQGVSQISFSFGNNSQFQSSAKIDRQNYDEMKAYTPEGDCGTRLTEKQWHIMNKQCRSTGWVHIRRLALSGGTWEKNP